MRCRAALQFVIIASAVPIDVSELKTKSGHPIVRAHFAGEVTVDEARRYHALIATGGKYDDWGHLATGNITGVSSEVRKVLQAQSPPDPNNPPPVAVVLTSAVVRMAAALTMRLSNNTNTDSFKTEADALAWLDGRMTEYLAKKRPPPKK
ncbi:MAG: hypothetical protein U0228_31740 [Myxococcaceae bacterium]